MSCRVPCNPQGIKGEGGLCFMVLWFTRMSCWALYLVPGSLHVGPLRVMAPPSVRAPRHRSDADAAEVTALDCAQAPHR